MSLCFATIDPMKQHPLMKLPGTWRKMTDGGASPAPEQWLEEETFRFRCVHDETNKWLAHAEILTTCSMVLDIWEPKELPGTWSKLIDLFAIAERCFSACFSQR